MLNDISVASLSIEESYHSQMMNKFHSWYHAKGKLCPIVIDDSSCVNVARLRLVEKLNLPTIVHLRPYKLHLLSEKGEMVVDK
ncbi:hypothetical protein CR513_14826, partial [Mucuna pruriens]